MNEKEFRERFEAERPILDAWGGFVTREVTSALKERTDEASAFLKIPADYRVKETSSALSKAFIRKNYRAYEEMKDRVGARFVVLLTDDINILSGIIEAGNWDWEKDRDFEVEMDLDPLVFDYQSVHYVVTSHEITMVGDVEVPAGIPCEIQLRTLLQHAYSELTHDTVYKPKLAATSSVKRMMARSMALIETTDEIFRRARSVINESLSGPRTVDEVFDRIYSTYVGDGYERKSRVTDLIIDALGPLMPTSFAAELEEYIDSNKFIVKLVRSRAYHNLLYAQPIIFMLYYLVSKDRHAVKESWPLTMDELEPLFTDLGISLER